MNFPRNYCNLYRFLHRKLTNRASGVAVSKWAVNPKLPVHATTSGKKSNQVPASISKMAITDSNPRAPEPSALTTLIESASASGNPLAATTLQVLHNLQHQHLWTSLQIHDIPTSQNPGSARPDPSPQDAVRSLISGIPPHRIYTHPDEQLYLLDKGLREDDLKPERMFVIPTSQGQAWSLRRMAAAFDALSDIRVGAEDETGTFGENADPEKAQKLKEYYARREEALATKEWGSQRMLLAMVDKGMGGEGTVVYYVVQEGEVKPRQN